MNKRRFLATAVCLAVLISAFIFAGCNKKFVISFETFGGSSVSPITAEAGSDVNLPAAVPTKDGYKFDGWYSDAELNNIAEFPIVLNADITLYAKWLGKNMINFDSNGGSSVESLVGFKNDYVLAPVDPVRDGYRFDGWYTGLDFIMPYHFYNGRQIPAKDFTVYAKWTKVFAVTFVSPSGLPSADGLLLAAGESIAEPTGLQKTGWVLEGWYSDSGMTEAYTFGKMPESDITLYAKWREVSSNVSVVFINGAASITASGLTEGSALTEPDFSGKNTGMNAEYYSMAGWYDEEGFEYDLSKGVPTGDMTLTALWVRNAKYALVIFTDASGGEIDRIFVEKNTYLTEASVTEGNVAAGTYFSASTVSILIYSDKTIVSET